MSTHTETIQFRIETVPEDETVKGSTRTHRVVRDVAVVTQADIVGRYPLATAQLILERLNACHGCALWALRMGPDHDGSAICHSGSLKSGGEVAHCGCEVCWGGKQ